MELLNNKIVVGLIVVVTVYAIIRLLIISNRSSKVYEKQIDQILNSEEYKVKGRFED